MEFIYNTFCQTYHWSGPRSFFLDLISYAYFSGISEYDLDSFVLGMDVFRFSINPVIRKQDYVTWHAANASRINFDTPVKRILTLDTYRKLILAQTDQILAFKEMWEAIMP